jgi:hypothetical protein
MSGSNPAVTPAAIERQGCDSVRVLVAVLLVGSAIAALGLYIGPLRFLRHGGSPWTNILPATFAVWESRPFTSHFLLAFQTPETVAQGQAYTSYSPFWLVLLYAFLRPLNLLGVAYEQGQIALSLPHGALILALLAVHLRRLQEYSLAAMDHLQRFQLVIAAVAVTSVLTLPSFWVPFFRFNPEQYFFLPALAFCHLAAADYRSALHPRRGLALLLGLALVAPLFAPFAAVSWWVLWELPSNRRSQPSRHTLLWLLAITVSGTVTFLLPRMMVHLTEFSATGSGFFFRSGLDGSQEYFSSMLQAVWAPSYAPGRPWQLFQWPIAALAAIGATATVSLGLATRMLRQLFVSWIPFLWALIIFPQWVSIHPYFFDFHVAFGAAFCLAFWAQRPELDYWLKSPAVRLAVLMAGVALVMTNAIDLARAAH